MVVEHFYGKQYKYRTFAPVIFWKYLAFSQMKLLFNMTFQSKITNMHSTNALLDKTRFLKITQFGKLP